MGRGVCNEGAERRSGRGEMHSDTFGKERQDINEAIELKLSNESDPRKEAMRVVLGCWELR